MGVMLPGRAGYRVWQFIRAVAASFVALDGAELEDAGAYLPETAWPLFVAMPRADQRHSLSVLSALRKAGYEHPPLLQAALLHDCAKHVDGVHLWHRVAIVLVKAFLPGRIAQWHTVAAPARESWQYAFWAHVNHPQRGAELAAAAGCDPLAVTLIRHHQSPSPAETGNEKADLLLAILRAVDDNN
jgi:hypothetical protein